MNSREVFWHLGGMVFALGWFVVTLQYGFFGLRDGPDLVATLSSFFTALLILLGAEHMALRDRLSGNTRDVIRHVNRLRHAIPETTAILRFATCDEALQDLAEHLPKAQLFLNTAISRDGVQSGQEAQKAYTTARETALGAGIRIEDIVSQKFEADAKQLHAKAQKKQGEYDFAVLDSDPPCFLNFGVLEYPGGEAHVWLGWATSSTRGVGLPAFRIRDRRVAEYFRAYHGALKG